MKYFHLILVCVCLSAFCAAQPIEEMIQTERSFSAMARREGTKQAFLHYLDSAGIVFQNAMPVNAKEAFSTAPEGSGLFWQPDYALISTGNNFGFTSGPWYSMKDGARVGSGRFHTIWQKKANGEWRALLDFGVWPYPCDSLTDTLLVVRHSLERKAKFKGRSALYADSVWRNSTRPDLRQVASNALVNINGELSAQKQTLLRPGLIKDTRMELQGSGRSPAGDMVYVYGRMTRGATNGNFLRVWTNVSGAWQLLLEVISFKPKDKG